MKTRHDLEVKANNQTLKPFPSTIISFPFLPGRDYASCSGCLGFSFSSFTHQQKACAEKRLIFPQTGKGQQPTKQVYHENVELVSAASKVFTFSFGRCHLTNAIFPTLLVFIWPIRLTTFF